MSYHDEEDNWDAWDTLAIVLSVGVLTLLVAATIVGWAFGV